MSAGSEKGGRCEWVYSTGRRCYQKPGHRQDHTTKPKPKPRKAREGRRRIDVGWPSHPVYGPWLPCRSELICIHDEHRVREVRRRKKP